MKHLLKIFLILLLTILTQTGGFILLLAYWCQWKWPHKWGTLRYFTIGYVLSLLLIPIIAQPLGRVPLPVFATKEVPLKPQNLLLVLTNRHYVKPKLKDLIIKAAQTFSQKQEGLIVTYLDANFPFFDGFPLLPHRSHDDGEKLDLCFLYKDLEELIEMAP